MSAYVLLKLLHILSSTLLFGTGLGTAFFMWFTWRSGNLAAIASASRLTVLADWCFTTPAVLIQPVTGIALVRLMGFPWSNPVAAGCHDAVSGSRRMLAARGGDAGTCSRLCRSCTGRRATVAGSLRPADAMVVRARLAGIPVHDGHLLADGGEAIPVDLIAFRGHAGTKVCQPAIVE